MKTRFALLLAAACFASRPAGAAKITFDDLYSMPRASDPQVSPDGKRIAFVLKEQDARKGEAVSHVWLMDLDGGSPRRLTHGPSGGSHPRWSPDGSSLAFSSRRNGNAQVFALPLTGGEARPLVSLCTGSRDMEWSPGGESFLFVSSVFPDCADDGCNKVRQEKDKARPLEAKQFNHLLFRHYNRWDDHRINQLFLAQVSDGSYRNVYRTGFHVPTRLLGGWGDFAFSPDGRQICFVMSTDENPAVWVNNDLYIIPAQGGRAERITTGAGLDTTPRYSPDGRFLCYLSTARAGYEADQRDLVLYTRDTKEHTNLTPEFDRSVGEYLWGPKSKAIYFTAIDHGLSKVYSLNLHSKRIDALLEDAVYGDLAITPDGRYLILSMSRAHQPHELYRYNLKTGKLIRLTRFTDEITSGLELIPAEAFRFDGALGDPVWGFLTKPPAFDASKQYPLVLLIHGGPQWCWLSDFNTYGWNTQLVAAQGYVVAQIDPHGSLGYGLKFKEYVSGNWGKGDYEDLMKGVDYLIARHPFIDSSRMAALGRSYGGFMTNWICGHTDRFRCLISVDGTSEHISEYGATEELWFPEWECRGTPWSNPEEYIRSSPATYAANFKTPTMVIHGQQDYRVDVSQGLVMFTFLERQGVPSRLLYFPDEGHSVQKIQNLRYVYEEQFRWLARWLEGGG